MLVESVRRLWNEWEIRVMVLISLSFQIILIMLGNRRKYSTSNWVKIVVWSTYMGADWIATVALGVLCNKQGDIQYNNNADNTITALWAPFLLMHLGGPDTITAYVLEDNELWLRHLLGLFVQVGVAIYVFIRSLTTDTYRLIFLAIPLFVAGIFKYGERTWVLRSASSEHFRDSLLPPPNAGPDYERLARIKKYDDSVAASFSMSKYGKQSHLKDNNEMKEADRPNILPDAFHEAHGFFMTFRRLYVDLIFNLDEIKRSSGIFGDKTPDEAFKCIELELGYMFDFLYTKASLVHSWTGSFILRPISFISTLSAFVGFLIVDKKGYSSVNIIITYILLVGATVLEIYAVIILLSSDWAMLRLREPKSTLEDKINQAISSLNSAMNGKKRRSYSMSQYNLISLCLRRRQRLSKRTMCYVIQNEFGIYEKLEKYQQIDQKNASTELKECIFKHILQKVKSLNGSFERGIELCRRRGDQVIQEFCNGESDERIYAKLIWSIEVEFDESILLWHIATELCFHALPQKIEAKETSKLLSDYMLYLLVMRPFMLPKGIWQIRYQDTAEEAVRFFRDRLIETSEEACQKLLSVDCDIPESEVKGDGSKTVLFDGCRLAKSLLALVREEGRKIEDTWEMISNVWVEMLCYAANQCRWNQHAQQLRRGGELLTHVSLLMTHLGLTEQLKIFKGDSEGWRPIVPMN